MDLNYTITKFDNETKSLVVTFDDGAWAEIRLATPLPNNLDELEKIIAQFSAPKEVVEAQQATDIDLSYIDSVIGVARTCPRLSLLPKESPEIESSEIDPSAKANADMWADVEFQKKVAAALVKFGVLQADPTTIPVNTVE